MNKFMNQLIHDLDDSDSAAYNFVLCFRDGEGECARTCVGLLDRISDASHVLDCLLAAHLKFFLQMVK